MVVMRCWLMRSRWAGKSKSLGMKERNEVKRKIVYFLGIRFRLAFLSIYGGRGSLNRKYKAKSPSPTLLVIPLWLWSAGPIPADYSDPIRALLASPSRPCMRIRLYPMLSRYIPSSWWYIMTDKEDEQLTSNGIRKGTKEIHSVVKR